MRLSYHLRSIKIRLNEMEAILEDHPETTSSISSIDPPRPIRADTFWITRSINTFLVLLSEGNGIRTSF